MFVLALEAMYRMNVDYCIWCQLYVDVYTGLYTSHIHDMKASQSILDLLAPTIDAHSICARRVMIPVLENMRLSYVAFTARTMLYVSNMPAFLCRHGRPNGRMS